MLPNNDYIIFDTQINKKQGYFLFDTHSSVNVLFKKPWDTLEYQKTGETLVNGVQTKTILIDSMLFGTAKYYNIEAVLINDDNDVFKNMSGIIGINIDRKANWIFDFENEVVELHKSKLNENMFGFFLKYKVDNRHNRLPYVEAKINKKKINLKIDTGYENELKISQLNFFNTESIEFKESNPATVFGRQEEKTAKLILDKIEISDIDFKNIETEYINESNNSRLNLLGIKFFKRFNKVGIDTQQKKLFFEEK